MLRLLPAWMRRGQGRLRPPLALVALTLCAAWPASAHAARPLPAQGVYDTCKPAASRDHCASRLRRVGAAGFKVVEAMGGLSGADLPDIKAFAAAAQSSGVKIIWTLSSASDPIDFLASNPLLAARCGCLTRDATLAYLIGILRAQPATWGYYIADEPKPEDHARVAALSNRVRSLDPAHERVIVGCGLCWGGEKSVSFLADIDAALGTDAYPVHDQAPDSPVVSRRVGDDAAGLRRVAGEGRKTVMTLQAWRWGDSYYDAQATGLGAATRYPTRREIQMQRDAAITRGHPDLILWFTLNQVIGWEPGQRPWFWDAPPNPDQRWANLVGGAFAPGPNDSPVAAFTVRARRSRTRVKLMLDGRGSFDPDGRITTYRWYASGKRVRCRRARCSLAVRRGGRRTIKLLVIDSDGARAVRARSVRVTIARRH